LKLASFEKITSAPLKLHIHSPLSKWATGNLLQRLCQFSPLFPLINKRHSDHAMWQSSIFKYVQPYVMKDCLGFGGEFRLEWKWVWTLKRMGKMEDVDLEVFGTGGIHATWTRFQDKWGRSATLNQRFKDKDRWF